MKPLEIFFESIENIVIENIKEKIIKGFKKSAEVSEEKFLEILNDRSMFFKRALNAQLHSLQTDQLSQLTNTVVFHSRNELIEKILNSKAKKAFKKSCFDQLKPFLKQMKTDIGSYVATEQERRNQIQEEKRKIKEKKQAFLTFLETGTDEMKAEIHELSAYIVTDLFINKEKKELYHRQKTAAHFMKKRPIAKKFHLRISRKWLSLGIKQFKKDYGENYFDDLQEKTLSLQDTFFKYMKKNNNIQNTLDEMTIKVKKENFQELFQKGIKDNTRLKKAWNKERVRRLFRKK